MKKKAQKYLMDYVFLGASTGRTKADLAGQVKFFYSKTSFNFCYGSGKNNILLERLLYLRYF